MVVGLELDDVAQQRLHLVEAAELLGHHGLLVDQVGVAGEARRGGLEHGQRGGVVRLLAQQLGLGQQAGAGVLVAGVGGGLQQLAAFGQLALPGEQAGMAELHVQAGAVDLVQRGFGGLQVAALLGRLGQQQPGAPPAVRAGLDLGIAARGRRVQAPEAFVQRGLGGVDVLQVQFEGAQGQPGRRVVGRLLGQQPELARRVDRALGLDQRAGIGLAQRVLVGLLLQAGGDEGFGLGLGGQQVDGELHRVVAVGQGGGEVAGQGQRARVLAGLQRQPGFGEQRGRLERAGLGLQNGRQRGEHGLGLRRALEQPRQGCDQAGALHVGRDAQQGRQRLRDFGGLVQQGQQLHDGLVGIHRAGLGLGPGAGRHQRLVAGVGLQRDVDDALEELLVAGAARGVQQHLEGRAGLAAVEFEFADQQLVEQRRVHRRVGRRAGGRGRGGIGCLGLGLQGDQQGGGAGGAAEGGGHSNSGKQGVRQR